MPSIQDGARLASVSPVTRYRILALIVPDIVNPFYASVAGGVEATARKKNCRLFICHHNDDSEKESGYFEAIISMKIDGCLLIPSGDKTNRSIQLLADHDLPFVMIDRYPNGSAGDYVGGDSLNGAVDLVELFVSDGHRRIALINGPKSISTARDRFFGYKLGLEQNGIRFDSELVYTGKSFDPRIAGAALDQFLSLADPPTAVLAANNLLALEFVRAVRERGMDIPSHYALACFDQIEPIDLVKPTVTMAIQPAYEFGALAVRWLLEKLDGVPVEAGRRVILRPEIKVGESTKGFVQREERAEGPVSGNKYRPVSLSDKRPSASKKRSRSE
jgi:LacI family transcriptional regulator